MAKSKKACNFDEEKNSMPSDPFFLISALPQKLREYAIPLARITDEIEIMSNNIRILREYFHIENIREISELSDSPEREVFFWRFANIEFTIRRITHTLSTFTNSIESYANGMNKAMDLFGAQAYSPALDLDIVEKEITQSLLAAYTGLDEISQRIAKFRDYLEESRTRKRKPEKVYTTEATAEIMGVAPKTIRRWLREGKIKGIKIGKSWKIKKREIDRVKNKGLNKELSE